VGRAIAILNGKPWKNHGKTMENHGKTMESTTDPQGVVS